MSTRLQIRRDILKTLGDLRVLTASANGTDVTFPDYINLPGEVGAYTGREVLFTGGTAANLGQIRTVTGSSATQRSLGFGTALPAAIVLGDEAEMINTRGVRFHFQDVHDAINQSIRIVADRALVPAATESSTFTVGSDIELPNDFVTVEDVLALDQCQYPRWHSIRKATRPDGYGWWLDRSSRTVVISGRVAWRNDTRTVKVIGLTTPAELNDDLDVTSISHEWLVANTSGLLARARHFMQPTPELERLTYMQSQKADSILPRVTARRGPFSELI